MLISVTMALDSLREQATVVSEAEENLTRQRAIRDNLIIDAHEANVPMRKLITLTGLSRDRLYTIANSPRRIV